MVAALPIAVMAGSAAISALAQWLNSREALEATDAERARVQAIFDKMQAPDFDFSRLTPEEFRVVGTYAPDVAPYIAEANPELVRAETPDAMAGRAAQREALQRLMETSRAGGMGDELLQAQMQQANLQGAQALQQTRNAIQSQMARRGQMGSGLDYALQLAGGAQPQMQAAQAGISQATEAYRQKLNALRGAADLGGTIRGEDVALSGQNAAIINAFNQRVAQARRNAALNQQDVQNEAQRYNLGQRQSAADRNVQTRNQFQTQERNRADDLRQQQFENQMGIARGQAGLSDQRVDDIMGAARQRNQTIQSIGDVGVMSGELWNRQENYNRDLKRRNKFYQKVYGIEPEEWEE
jgi:hypothetical protein